MFTRSQHLTLTGLGATALVLVLANGALFASNKRTSAEISDRQTAVQQTSQLQGLQTEIAKALADLAIKSNDKAVLDMLQANGITVTMNAPQAGAKPAPAKR